ncbi:PREDICTED: transcription termination factor MTERF2, chloroplastic [Lupinus angustifolius]|uniref:transcription termination factor MTERF2, chloroplastic n=1 Tax=Lupinus angustifolius TaxID=3871 RepID=UPI00092F94B9|nr:PREDICTED: transcription termination factor MTERF2, chloroplastic [Lupinus angustifolius]
MNTITMFTKFLQIHTTIPFLPLPPFPHHNNSNNSFLIFKHNPQFQFQFHYYETRRRRRRRRNGHCCRCDGSSELEVQEARKAVSTFLQELGVSEEDSISIASKSPSYLNMLMDGVRDLDQLSSIIQQEEEEEEEQNLKDKIIHIATQKGDKGKVAYLESLGFTLSSSMNVARYLSAETLPSLIHKVTSMKLLFFNSHSHHNQDFLIKNIRRMMLYLSISIDDDLQHTLSFFAKVEARRGGLKMLSSKDSAFNYLIESFPRLLLLSVDDHMMHTVEFLENIGIPRVHISYMILCFPPILLWNLRVLKNRVLALKEIDLVDGDYIRLLLNYPWVLSTSIQENYEEVLAFFHTENIPKTLLDRAIQSQPHLLACSTSKLKLMVDQFAELGVISKRLDRVITKSPQLLLLNLKDFLKIVLFFENMGFDGENIGRILARCPEIFATSIDKTLQRKIEFLCGIGVSETYLARVIRKYPELLVYDTDNTLPHRIMYLMKLGLSEKDIAFMVRTFSPLLGYSIEEVLRPKIEFLVNSMGRPVRDVVGYPRYFSYSLEKKIKPRYWVLKERNIKCSLKDMLGKNDEEFAAEFMCHLASHDGL